MKCEKCGNDILEGQQVCLICGTPIGQNKGKNNRKNEDNGKSLDEKSQQQKNKPVKAPRVHKDFTSLFIIFGLLFSVFSLTAFLLFTFYKLYVTPKTVFMNTMDNISDSANVNISRFHNNGQYKIFYSSDNSIDSFDEIVNFFSNLNISSDLMVDNSIEEIVGSLNIKYKNEDLFNQQKMYGKEKKVYLIDPQSNDYVEMENDYNDYLTTNSKNVSAYKTFISELKNALRVSLSEKYFKEYKETINLNGQNMEVTKNELVLNNDNIKEFQLKLYKYLYNSKKYISSVAQIKSKNKKDFKKKKDKIKKELKNTLNDLKKEETTVSVNDIVVDIYTKGLKNEFVKMVVKRGINASELMSVFFDSEDKMNIQINANNKNFTLKMSKDQNADKTSYLFDYSNGYENFKASIEYIINRQAEFKPLKIKNYLKTDKMDKTEKNSIKNRIINSTVKKQLKNDRKQIIDWLEGALREFKPSIVVPKKNEPSEQEPPQNSGNQEGMSPSGEGSVEWMQQQEDSH